MTRNAEESGNHKGDVVEPGNGKKPTAEKAGQTSPLRGFRIPEGFFILHDR